MRHKLHMAAAAWLAIIGSGTHAAAQTAQPCLTTAEAEALITAMMPAMLTAANATCSSVLPATAYLRTNSDALIRRYAAPSLAAKPVAIAALGKLAGAGSSVTAEMFDAMAGPMLTAALADAIQPQNCRDIDRVAALLDPLPPANLSALVATILELAADAKTGSPVTICKPAN
jgi:hypothetical protein